MRSADEINQFTWVGWRKQDPFSIFDRLAVNGNQWLDWDYAGNFLGPRYNVNSNAQFKNKYSAGFGITREDARVSNTALRGGPSSEWPGDWEGNLWVNTDRRKKVSSNFGAWARRGDEASRDDHEVWAGIVYRPTDALRLSLSASKSRNQPEMQYVDTLDFEGASGTVDRFVFGGLDQETTALTARIDYSITPNLTVQFYGQPFISTGRYSEFKRITDPRAAAYRDRFEQFLDGQLLIDADGYSVDENRDGVVDYAFGNPDFDFRDFNSTLVVRWEYRPGSAFFVVWNQMRSNGALLEDRGFNNGLSELFGASADNVVLVKFSRWLSP